MDIQKFKFNTDLLQHLLWQYNDAENLQKLLQTKHLWYAENNENFWIAWIRDVFDLRTATNFGLQVWAIILDLPLFAGERPSPPDFPAFGFGSDNRGFVNSPDMDANGFFATTGSRFNRLTTEEKRQVLQLRFYQTFSTGSVNDINKNLRRIFGVQGDGINNIYAVDKLNMTLEYTYSSESITTNLIAVMQRDELDVLPTPAAVRAVTAGDDPPATTGVYYFDNHMTTSLSDSAYVLLTEEDVPKPIIVEGSLLISGSSIFDIPDDRSTDTNHFVLKSGFSGVFSATISFDVQYSTESSRPNRVGADLRFYFVKDLGEDLPPPFATLDYVSISQPHRVVPVSATIPPTMVSEGDSIYFLVSASRVLGGVNYYLIRNSVLTFSILQT